METNKNADLIKSILIFFEVLINSDLFYYCLNIKFKMRIEKTLWILKN